MTLSTSTSTLAAGASRTFNLSPGSALTLVAPPNVRATVTETPNTVSASDVGGNASRTHNLQMVQTVTYGPYPMGGTVVVANASNSGATITWVRSDSIVAESAGGSVSLVSGDGTPISFAGPAYTWVNRPAAASNAGMVIRITDIGPTGFGSMWMSDGTNWRTLTGEQVLISGRTGVPGTALATATTAAKLNLPAGDMITAGSLVFPAGLLRPGVGLRINSFIRHTGTAGTWSAIFRIGTSNSASDSSLARGEGSATNDQTLWTFMDCNIATNTSITTAYNMQPNAAASGGSYAARTTNIDFTAATYLGIYVSALTPPDTIELQNYSISLLD